MSVGVHSDVLVVGAGPAGLIAAIECARAGRSVRLIEANREPARKLLASGGGRCNLTNTLSPAEMAARFPDHNRFVAAVLKSFGPDKLRRWFHDLGVATHAPDGFHVFPTTHRAASVRDALLAEVARLRLDLRLSTRITDLVPGSPFTVVAQGGQSWQANYVVVTCGGVGYPELGDGSGLWQVLRALGHSLAPPLPGMVPLITEETWVADCRAHTLPKVQLAIDGFPETWTGDVIFTRHGLAGPVVLDASRAVSAHLATHGKAALHLRLHGGQSPDAWPGPSPVDGSLRLTVTATEGLPRAMVTRGGIPPRELDVRTLSSRIVPGLHLAGEVLDIDGPCGGYNLQWAFASGHRIARALT